MISALRLQIFPENDKILPWNDIMKVLKWKTLPERARGFHLAHNGISGWHDVPVHSHDFAEVFLVVRGSGVHRINGHSTGLSRGDLVMIAPGDSHRISASSDDLWILNLAFPGEVLLFFQKRYFGKTSGFWGGNGALPRMVHLADRQLERVHAEMESLGREYASKLLLDRFLMNLIVETGRLGLPGFSPETDLPEWLADACRKVRLSEEAVSQPADLAAIAGRSLEHVSRVLKRHLGKTPTELLNEIRLERAACLLAAGQAKILDIAADCGFLGISYFYSSFRKRYGMSPRRYRIRCRHVFG